MRPAWSEQFDPDQLSTFESAIRGRITREWAFGRATGKGVKVAVLDSGIEAAHPAVGGLAGGVAIVAEDDAEDGFRVVENEDEDQFGHGTACAGIIRSLAPQADIWSVRVLGEKLSGKGWILIEGIRWAIEHGMRVLNLSLSTGNVDYYGELHELADDAYFNDVVLVCAVNNVPGPSFPSLYSSVISVAAHEGADAETFLYNPNPPVEFGAPGIDIEVAWKGGKTVRATGNSFAAPHITGLVARLLSKHPELKPFQVKTVLAALAANAAAGK
jgi:subtilisin family serine protease